MSIDLHIVLHINSTNSVQFFSVQLGDVGVGSCTADRSCFNLNGMYNVYFVLILLFNIDLVLMLCSIHTGTVGDNSW